MADLIIGLVVFGIIALAGYSLYSDKKKGVSCSSCGSSCSGCGSKCSYSESENIKTE